MDENSDSPEKVCETADDGQQSQHPTTSHEDEAPKQLFTSSGTETFRLLTFLWKNISDLHKRVSTIEHSLQSACMALRHSTAQSATQHTESKSNTPKPHITPYAEALFTKAKEKTNLSKVRCPFSPQHQAASHRLLNI